MEESKDVSLSKDMSLSKSGDLSKTLDLSIPELKKSDIFLAMVVCSLFLKDVPMNFREKVLLVLLITKYIDIYIKTEADIMWADKQIKRMESELKRNEQVNRLEQGRDLEQL